MEQSQEVTENWADADNGACGCKVLPYSLTLIHILTLCKYTLRHTVNVCALGWSRLDPSWGKPPSSVLSRPDRLLPDVTRSGLGASIKFGGLE